MQPEDPAGECHALEHFTPHRAFVHFEPTLVVIIMSQHSNTASTEHITGGSRENRSPVFKDGSPMEDENQCF